MIEVFGADWCADCRRSKALLDRLGVSYAYLDVDKDDGLRDRAIEIADGATSIPVIVFPDGVRLIEPSDPELREQLRRSGLVVEP